MSGAGEYGSSKVLMLGRKLGQTSDLVHLKGKRSPIARAFLHISPMKSCLPKKELLELIINLHGLLQQMHLMLEAEMLTNFCTILEAEMQTSICGRRWVVRLHAYNGLIKTKQIRFFL